MTLTVGRNLSTFLQRILAEKSETEAAIRNIFFTIFDIWGNLNMAVLSFLIVIFLQPLNRIWCYSDNKGLPNLLQSYKNGRDECVVPDRHGWSADDSSLF